MAYLILGLIIFLGVHSVRIVAEDWRNATRARLGAHTWKALYALASLAGVALIIWGYGQARLQPLVLWSPPMFLRHLAAPLVTLAFVLILAADIPGNRIKARLHHPMLLGTKLWALAHLLANGTLHDVILFGAILAWAILCYRSCRQRDAAAGTVYPAGRAAPTIATIVAGIAATAVFAAYLHVPLIGVRPF